MIESAKVCSLECAIRCNMTSVSLVVWKIDPLSFQAGAQFGGVHQVAVVRHGHRAFTARHRKRLRVQQGGIARGGVSRMADRQRAGKVRQYGSGENISHQAHAFFQVQAYAVGGGNARRFLAPMLQGVEPQISYLGCFSVVVYRNDATFFTKLVQYQFHQCHQFLTSVASFVVRRRHLLLGIRMHDLRQGPCPDSK